MSDGGRVPLVTAAGMDRSGRAIIGWVVGWIVARTRPSAERSDLNPLEAGALWVLGDRDFDALTGDRRPEFPTVTEGDFSDQRTYEAHRLSDASKPGAALAFVLVGIVGLVGLCAIYPVIVLWILSVASGGNALIWSPITVGIATSISVVLALLADRLIPGRVALSLIASVPLAVGLIAAAS